MSFFFLLAWLTIWAHAVQSATQTLVQNVTSTAVTTNSTQKPVYNIGVLFPNTSVVITGDPTLADMIVTCELAVELALQSIQQNNLLPDVELNITRYYSDETNPGKTAFAVVDMVENGVSAVIGDMNSAMTEASAAITGIWQIPQCSPTSNSYDLTDRSIYPYYFSTTGNIVLYGPSLIDWIQNMGWTMFSLIYTNDNAGQQLLHTMISYSSVKNIMPMTLVPIYSLDDDQIEAMLNEIIDNGSRVVVLADSNPNDQIAILQKAMQMGLLTNQWAWILTNDISALLAQNMTSPEELAMYDGLMFISDLWNLTGETSYDNLHQLWQTQNVPSGFSNPSAWNTTGLSYGAPSAYTCTELLALGLNKALNSYTGGRAAGLAALANKQFSSSSMVPGFFNLNYTGPAGYMDFGTEGDLQSGYFTISYMTNGASVPYATVKLGEIEFIPNTTITYLGGTMMQPMDMISQYALNPAYDAAPGIAILVICGFGLFFTNLMLILIACFRKLKPISVASPLFCGLQLLGIDLSYIAVILYFDKPTVAKCITRQILLLTGFVMVIGSIIAKNYRLYKIFNNSVRKGNTEKLQARYMIRIVGIFWVVFLIPLIVWYGVYPVTIINPMVTDSAYCWLCVYPTATVGNWVHLNAAELATLCCCAVLILISAFLAYKTRSATTRWSETVQVSYVSYNTALAAIAATPAIFLGLEEYETAIYLKLACILFASSFTLVVLYIPKFIIISRHILKNSMILSLYKMGPNVEDGNKAGQSHSYSNSDNDYILNQSTPRFLDYTVQTHEVVLPVKKQAKYELFVIWKMKHLILIPSRGIFILSDEKTGKNANMYYYDSCEKVEADDCFLFQVRTKEGLGFLCEVSDQPALERWIEWFQEKDKKPLPAVAAPKPKKINSISYKRLSFESDYDEKKEFHGMVNETIELPLSKNVTSEHLATDYVTASNSSLCFGAESLQSQKEMINNTSQVSSINHNRLEQHGGSLSPPPAISSNKSRQFPS